MSYNSGVIVLVISNHPCAMCLADLKSLARLLPELFSTQSYYHYALSIVGEHILCAELNNMKDSVPLRNLMPCWRSKTQEFDV